MLLKACLNGARSRAEHAALPLSPGELAGEARAAVDAGAGALHLHPRDGAGRESLAVEDVGAALRAVRDACPETPIGVTTGAWIEPSVERRLELIGAWSEEPPDFASVNFDEDGAREVAAALRALGIGVEAGLSLPGDVALCDDGPFLRVLIEPDEREGDAAWATAGDILAVLDAAGIEAPRLAHGYDTATWTVISRAAVAGLDGRIGLEDTLTLPDGAPASGNGELVAAAVALLDPRAADG